MGEPTIRPMTPDDAAAVWGLVQAQPQLNNNSFYLYHLLGTHFSSTCRVAELDGVVVGAVTGYRPPSDPETLFVWQLVVGESARKRGIASALVRALIATQSNKPVRVQATISPGNEASYGVFRALARSQGTELDVTRFLDAERIPDEGGKPEHEDLVTCVLA